MTQTIFDRGLLTTNAKFTQPNLSLAVKIIEVLDFEIIRYIFQTSKTLISIVLDTIF